MNFFKKPYSIAAFVFAILFVGTVVIRQGFAWTSPTSNPPLGVGTINISNGNVGIGTGSPAYKLDVRGGGFNVNNGGAHFSYDGAADVTFAYPGRGAGGRAIVADVGNMLTLNYAGDFTGGTKIDSALAVTGALTTQGKSVCLADGTNCQAASNYWTTSGNNIYNNNSGNVGVGTSAPGYKLDVSGNGRFSSDLNVGGSISYGSAGTRTEYRDDAGAMGGRSGFYETWNPINFPAGASSWWHLLDVRHSNTTNNYAMQFAGSFFDQNLYFRKTNNNGAQPWVRVLTTADGVGTVNGSGTVNSIPKWTATNGLGNSRITDDGTTASFTNQLAVSGTTVTVANQLSVNNGGSNFGTTGTCCAAQTPTLSLSELTSSNGRLAWLQFHNGGFQEAFIRLKQSERVLQIGDSQSTGTSIAIMSPNNSAEVVRLYPSGNGYFAGNVGIGTATPGSPLHIGTGGWSANQLHFSSGWGTGGYHATIGSGYSGIASAGIMLGSPHVPWRASYGAKLRFASDQAASYYWDWGMNGEAGGSTDRFDLTRNNASLFTVTNGGKVGIGTTDPDASVKLHVSGGGIGLDNNQAIRAKASWGVMSDIVRLDASDKLNIRGLGGGLQISDSGGNQQVFVNNAGNVGIGTANPASKLSVGGDGSSGAGIYGNGGVTGVWGVGGGTGVEGQGGTIGVNGQGSLAGVYGVGTTYDFYANGAGVNYGAPSSIRWKSNVTPMSDILGKISNISTVYFDWDEKHGGQRDLGFIGEEVGKYFPEVVAWDKDAPGFVTGMDYSKMTPILLGAIKEQQKQIEEQKQEILELKKAVFR